MRRAAAAFHGLRDESCTRQLFDEALRAIPVLERGNQDRIAAALYGNRHGGRCAAGLGGLHGLKGLRGRGLHARRPADWLGKRNWRSCRNQGVYCWTVDRLTLRIPAGRSTERRHSEDGRGRPDQPSKPRSGALGRFATRHRKIALGVEFRQAARRVGFSPRVDRLEHRDDELRGSLRGRLRHGTGTLGVFRGPARGLILDASAEAEVCDRGPDERCVDLHPLRRMSPLERAIADAVDQPRHAQRTFMDRLERRSRELDPALAAAGDCQAMVHVPGDAGGVERRQLAADGDALIHLPHLRQPEARSQLGLADEHDLQELLATFQLREDANLLEQRQRQVLRLVDDEHRKGLQRDQRIEEFVQRIAQVRSRGAVETPACQIPNRNHAKVDEQRLQQIFAGDERIRHERRERPPVQLFQHRSAEGRLAGADLSGQDDETFAAPDSRLKLVERRPVCRTPEQESRVG